MFQVGVNVDFLSCVVVAVNLPHDSHVVVAEGKRFRYKRVRLGMDFKDHFRVTHKVAILFASVGDSDKAVACGRCPDVFH